MQQKTTAKKCICFFAPSAQARVFFTTSGEDVASGSRGKKMLAGREVAGWLPNFNDAPPPREGGDLCCPLNLRKAVPQIHSGRNCRFTNKVTLGHQARPLGG